MDTNMEYEMVQLKEKTAVGITARTCNSSPEMKAVIGGLWQRFYGEQIYNRIEKKKEGVVLGIYTDYENREVGEYTVMAACEAKTAKSLPQGVSVRTIPAGTYAKFIVKGELHEAVGRFWSNLWAMELPRNFVCDFEEYQNFSAEEAEIHIYIGIQK